MTQKDPLELFLKTDTHVLPKKYLSVPKLKYFF